MLECLEQSGRAEAGKPSVDSGTYGVCGKQGADALARLGSSGVEPHIGLSNRQVASALSYWVLEGTTETWRKAEECRQAKEFIGVPRQSPNGPMVKESLGLKNTGCGFDRPL